VLVNKNYMESGISSALKIWREVFVEQVSLEWTFESRERLSGTEHHLYAYMIPWVCFSCVRMFLKWNPWSELGLKWSANRFSPISYSIQCIQCSKEILSPASAAFLILYMQLLHSACIKELISKNGNGHCGQTSHTRCQRKELLGNNGLIERLKHYSSRTVAQ
jgi:hypothetical protein